MTGVGQGEKLSFVRPRKEQRTVMFEAVPQVVEIDLSRSALLIVDMQNDFCHPDGWFPQRGVDPTPALALIPTIEKLAVTLRAADVPIIWLNWGIRADRANLGRTLLAKGKANSIGGYADPSPSGRGRILVRDDWGADVVDGLTVAGGDLVIHKHRLSGFWDNELDSVLRQRDISTLLFAGINTDRCVLTTLQDASFLGYDCILIDDATATPSPAFVRDAVIYLVSLLHGVVAQVDAILSAIGKMHPMPLPATTTPSERNGS